MLKYESTLRAAVFLCLVGLAASWGILPATSTRVAADDPAATNPARPAGVSTTGSAPPERPDSGKRDPNRADDWPLYRSDPESTGVARGELPDSLALLWKFAVPKGAFEGAAAIAGELAYLADLDGRVYALDLKTGDKRWQYETKSVFMAAPAVHEGAVYLGDIDGVFYCLEADSGKLRWKYEAGAEIDSGANFHGEHVLFGSQDATLYCLKAKTGQLVWTHAIADQIRCTPTISGDRAFVAGCDGQLHVIDVKLGKEVSAVEVGSPTGVTPAAVGDTVYFGWP
jgi:outer membrane protein assembly factor BamB